jgi:hypothetical protein
VSKTCEICGEPAEFVVEDHFDEAGWPGPLPRYYCAGHRPEDAVPIRGRRLVDWTVALFLLAIAVVALFAWLAADSVPPPVR